MLDEMIAKVKKAEYEADEKIKAAEAEANGIRGEAKEKAAYMIECAEKKARETTAGAIINIKEEEEKLNKVFDNETEKISNQLRENAKKHINEVGKRLREIMFA